MGKASHRVGTTDQLSFGRRSASGDIQNTGLGDYTGGSGEENIKMTVVSDQQRTAVRGFFSEASLELYDNWLLILDRLGSKADLDVDSVNELLQTLQQARNRIIGNKDVKRLLASQGIIKR